MKQQKQTNKHFWNLCQNFCNKSKDVSNCLPEPVLQLPPPRSFRFSVNLIPYRNNYRRYYLFSIAVCQYRNRIQKRFGWDGRRQCLRLLPAADVVDFGKRNRHAFSGLFFSLFFCVVLYSYIPVISYCFEAE